jgi:LTXXQ motif family protein
MLLHLTSLRIVRNQEANMRKFIAVSFIAASIGLTTGSLAYAEEPPASAELQMHLEARAALLDAHLAGFKAALKLTAEQEKTWSGFESVVRNIVKARVDEFKAMNTESEQRKTAIDLRMMSDDMAKNASELKALADAAAPLYASLDAAQKRNFGPLMSDLIQQGDEVVGWREGGHGPTHDD